MTTPEGAEQFVCTGGACFQSTFGVAAALCAVLALVPTIALLWVSTYGPKPAAAKESLAMQVRFAMGGGGRVESLLLAWHAPSPSLFRLPLQDAMISANAFDSQLEIDLDMIRADEHADSG